MKTFLQTIFLLFSFVIFGQQSTINEKIGYQAVVRNSQNQLVQNQNIKVKVSLMIGTSGEPFYIETHATQTNNNGLFNIQIGGGVSELGSYYNSIFWAGGNVFLKTEIDPLGGTNYLISSTTEFLSVPYSNSAKFAWSLIGASNNFVGFWKQTNIISGQYPSHVAISYISPDKFLVNRYLRTYGEGYEYGDNYIGFGTVTNATILGGWEAKILDMEASFGEDFYGKMELLNNVLTITFDYGEGYVEVYKYQKIE